MLSSIGLCTWCGHDHHNNQLRINTPLSAATQKATENTQHTATQHSSHALPTHNHKHKKKHNHTKSNTQANKTHQQTPHATTQTQHLQTIVIIEWNLPDLTVCFRKSIIHKNKAESKNVCCGAGVGPKVEVTQHQEQWDSLAPKLSPAHQFSPALIRRLGSGRS